MTIKRLNVKCEYVYKKTRSKNFIYLSLVETFRENGKVKHRTIAQLGRLDQLLQKGELHRFSKSLQAIGVASTDIPKIGEVDRTIGVQNLSIDIFGSSTEWMQS